MTFSTLLSALRAAGFNVYEDMTPAGQTSYITVSLYGLRRYFGDGVGQLRVWRCQLDCWCQSAAAYDDGGFYVSILDTLDGFDLAYSVAETGYDDEAKSYRMIIQCEVL